MSVCVNVCACVSEKVVKLVSQFVFMYFLASNLFVNLCVFVNVCECVFLVPTGSKYGTGMVQ